MKRNIFLTFLFLILTVVAGTAQDSNTQNSLLPEIDPQDIEIRSEFRARFPGIRRQPILGFNPKPRVFRIDPNRTPFMESDREAVANIALTQLDRPIPPKRNLLVSPQRTTAYVKAGFGNYITPELEAYVLRKLNPNSIASVNVDFTSSNGHLNNQDSGFRFLNVDGVYGTKLRKGANVSIKAGAFSDFNHLYELSIPGDNSGTAEKKYTGINTGVIISNNKNALEGWDLFANATFLTTDLKAPNAALRGSQSEQFLQAGFEKNWAGKNVYDVFSLKILAKGGNYTTENFGDTQWVNASVTAGYETLFNYATEMEMKGGLAFVGTGFENKALFVSDVSLNHTIKEGFNLLGAIYTRPEMKSVWEAHQQNRLLNIDSKLQHQYIFGIDGGLELKPTEWVKVYGTVSYQAINNYAFYARENQIFGVETFYELNYANASKFKLEVGATQQLVSNKVWFNGFVYAQRPELKTGNDIPFEERVGAEASFSFKPIKALSINTWAQYVGERETFGVTSETLSGFFLLNGGIDYQISEKVGLYAKLLNILGQEYEVWKGYEERPFQVFGGIKLTL